MNFNCKHCGYFVEFAQTEDEDKELCQECYEAQMNEWRKEKEELNRYFAESRGV